MAVSPPKSMVFFRSRSQRARITGDGKQSTTMGTPSFEFMESIRLGNCIPGRTPTPAWIPTLAPTPIASVD